MAYFPFFFELEKLTGLIVGGGRIALEKAEKLSASGARLRVVAPEILPELAGLPGVECIRREFRPEDTMAVDYCIAATGNGKVNGRVYEICRLGRIPVNVVDVKEKCDFIFPSLIRRGDLVIGVTSSGSSPQAAIELRKKIEEMIPDNIGEILEGLGGIREDVKARVPDISKRHRIFKKAAEVSLELGRCLSGEELEGICADILSE